MLAFAVIGIGVNALAAVRTGRKQSLNAQTVTWHLIEDVLGWVAVLIVSITLMFADLYILDPILSILFTLYILYNVILNLKKTLRRFLQAGPEYIQLKDVERMRQSIDNVVSTHHTHLWSLDGEHNVFTTHLIVNPNTTKDEMRLIKSQVKYLADQLSIEHITVDIEYDDGSCVLQALPHQSPTS